MKFTAEEKKLAKIYANQIEKLGFSDQFCDAHEKGDADFVRKSIAVAADEWAGVCDKMTSLWKTNPEFKQLFSAKILNDLRW